MSPPTCLTSPRGQRTRPGPTDSGKLRLADLRSCQDWQLRYYLKAVPVVDAETAVFMLLYLGAIWRSHGHRAAVAVTSTVP